MSGCCLSRRHDKRHAGVRSTFLLELLWPMAVIMTSDSMTCWLPLTPFDLPPLRDLFRCMGIMGRWAHYRRRVSDAVVLTSVSYTTLIFQTFLSVLHRTETVRSYLGWRYSWFLCPTTVPFDWVSQATDISEIYLLWGSIDVSKYCTVMFEGGAYFCRYWKYFVIISCLQRLFCGLFLEVRQHLGGLRVQYVFLSDFVWIAYILAACSSKEVKFFLLDLHFCFIYF